MKKKLRTKDFKLGIMVIGVFLLTYYGLNFLKGVNIFTPANYYYGQYENLEGLVASTPVFIKGYKVGQVDEIKYDFARKPSFTVKISVLKNVKLPSGTVIQMYENGLIGGKAVQLIIPEANKANSFHSAGDTLRTDSEVSILDDLATNMLPNLGTIVKNADSLMQSLRSILDNESVAASLKSIEETTSNFAQGSAEMNKLLSKDVPSLMNQTNALLANLNGIGANLNKIDYAHTFSEMEKAVVNVKTISEKINREDNTLGALINDKRLYDNFLMISSNVDSLVVDLKKSPKRYVHFSIFGKKQR